MKITYLHIKNFKSIRDLEIKDIENAMILVGKNNTGKTVVIDAIRIVSGEYKVKETEFLDSSHNIEISICVEMSQQDLESFHSKGIVSKYKRYDLWEKDFCNKLPSYQDGVLCFTCVINREGILKYNDGHKKNNQYIPLVFPKVYHIDQTRNIDAIQSDVLRFYDKESMNDIKENVCMFDKTRKCNRCFECIGVIHKKTTEELTAYEAEKLMEYKLFHANLDTFSEKVNHYFHRNGSKSTDIKFEISVHPEEMFGIETKVYNRERSIEGSYKMLSAGLKSIYALSMLEAYIDEDSTIPCIIMIEDPEIYLHPQLQKVASEILFRLSKKNQVIFSTHSPNMVFNFSSKQIKQVVLDEEYYTVIKEDTEIDEILDDLGYTANDLLNVSFVFIVEGKQDANRLPLLLEKYYSEIFDEDGKIQRISIIQTNSCTNIQTYAQLKYINKLYLKDQFLMIRDSDGKNPKHLVKQLCSYYAQREREQDVGNLPKVTPKNVLILKYYSFENYFLDPKIMAKIGVVKSEEEFYNILFKKYKDYLYKLSSVKRMIRNYNIRINSKEDIKKYLEQIKICVRGHNLYDIFYSKYRNDAEQEILKRYIDVAPPETFADILQAIDNFVYFENRRRKDQLKNIVLIGMPGAGKSTIGVVLAKVTGYEFVDSDLVIQKREKRLLSEIIKQEGLDRFIEIEGEVNASLDVERSIIATGGSAVYHDLAMQHFKETSTIVYIKLSYETLVSRLGDLKKRGVVLRENQTLKDLYAERHPLYEKYADYIVDGEGKSVETLMLAIREKLNL